MFYDISAYLKSIKNQCVEEIRGLLDFWLQHGMDEAYGGICTCVDKEGKRYSDQKPVWFQGRSLYGFAISYNDVYADPRYLKACASLHDFMIAHCFVEDDPHGKMYRVLERDGTPVSNEPNPYSEAFALMGLAEYYRATGNPQLLKEARALYETVLFFYEHPETLLKELAGENAPCPMPWYMMFLCSTQTLRRADPERAEAYTRQAACFIRDLKRYYYCEELHLFHEDRSYDDPGHGLEIAWFFMAEGLYTQQRELCLFGAELCRKIYTLAYDHTYGGMPMMTNYFGHPVDYPDPDRKFWWLQNELLIALMFAHQITEDVWFLEKFRSSYEYVTAHYIDREHGEWYALLTREGMPQDTSKGTLTKGPFHNIRQFVAIYDLLKQCLR